MSAQIIPFPQHRRGPSAQDAELVAFGRVMARRDTTITDDEARTSAREFLEGVERSRKETAGMTAEERLQRLAKMIATEIANAPPKAT